MNVAKYKCYIINHPKKKCDGAIPRKSDFIAQLVEHRTGNLEVTGSSNISNMRCSFSPDETPTRELKIRRAAEYF